MQEDKELTKANHNFPFSIINLLSVHHHHAYQYHSKTDELYQRYVLMTKAGTDDYSNNGIDVSMSGNFGGRTHTQQPDVCRVCHH